MTVVVKIGGNELADRQYVARLAQAIKGLEPATILVHGGGKEIHTLQQRLGLESNYVEGLRVTDQESLSVVQMVLAGLVNKRLVAALMAAEVDACGISGVDLGTVRAQKMEHPAGDLGWVGEVTQVRTEPLDHMLKQGVTPVLSPVCLGTDSLIYNVNADQVAEAVARAMKVDMLVFVSNVAGVLVDGKLLEKLSPTEAEGLIADGTIFGGMIPKVRSALKGVALGVTAVRITNIDGLLGGTGTIIS